MFTRTNQALNLLAPKPPSKNLKRCEMEFDNSKENDPEYLIEWYQYRAELHKNNPKVRNRYEKGVKELRKQIRINATKPT